MPPMPRHSRPMQRHHAQESSDRAALLSPPELAPTSADGVFVPHNGVITFNLNRPPTEKKTEGLQYQEALFRTSCLKKAVIRETHERGPGSRQKKCLTAGEPERPCFLTRGVKEAIGKYARLAPDVKSSGASGC